jgi:hypothetical protein
MHLTGLTLRALLATALLMAGLPVHAAPGNVIGSTGDNPPGQFLQSSESADSNCPSHLEVQSGASLEQSADTSEDCFDDGCCAGDCGCNCLGMTLVIPLKRAAMAMSSPGSGPVNTQALPAPLVITTLLRPPQA